MADDGQQPGHLMVLRHHGATGLADLGPLLESRSHQRPVRVHDVPADGPPELTEQVRGILALGGPMSVTDAAAHRWMEPEIELLLAACFADVPVFGICLGADLLATALDGEVAPRERPEVGYVPLTATTGAGDDDVFAGWPDESAVLVAHRDRVTSLPTGAVEMLSGDDGPVAWRTSHGASYGVRFHPEVGPEQLQRWLDDPELSSLFEDAGVDGAELLEEARRREVLARAVGVGLVGRWVDEVVGAD